MITRNAARCLKCNDEIESRHRHDFVECSCGAIHVDGGRAYLKRGWPEGDPAAWFVDLSESDDGLLGGDSTTPLPITQQEPSVGP